MLLGSKSFGFGAAGAGGGVALGPKVLPGCGPAAGGCAGVLGAGAGLAEFGETTAVLAL